MSAVMPHPIESRDALILKLQTFLGLSVLINAGLFLLVLFLMSGVHDAQSTTRHRVATELALPR